MKILVCRCEYADIIDRGAVESVTDRLQSGGVAFESVSDLCSLCESKAPALGRLSGAKGLVVVACYPRAVRWLFALGGASLPDDARVLNLRTQSACEIIDAIGPDAPRGDRTEIPAPRADEQVPWFPVIDYERCVNCKQCMNFCLFGVYAADDDGPVRTSNPLNCKLHCPACARVCPQTAIIFPKYAGAGPVAGDDGTELPEGEVGGVDLGEMMKGDVLADIRRRNGKGDCDGENTAEGVSLSGRLGQMLHGKKPE